MKEIVYLQMVKYLYIVTVSRFFKKLNCTVYT